MHQTQPVSFWPLNQLLLNVQKIRVVKKKFWYSASEFSGKMQRSIIWLQRIPPEYYEMLLEDDSGRIMLSLDVDIVKVSKVL